MMPSEKKDVVNVAKKQRKAPQIGLDRPRVLCLTVFNEFLFLGFLFMLKKVQCHSIVGEAKGEEDGICWRFFE